LKQLRQISSITQQSLSYRSGRWFCLVGRGVSKT
jgi:hypothetical protein